MHRVNDTNLNSGDYWDQVYIQERGSGKERIDGERLKFLIGSMKDWHSRNPQITRPMFLDVGCGDGELIRKVHAALPEWDLYGVDITPQTIAWAATVDPQFHYSVANAYELQFSPGMFNVVFCGETLEHLEQPEAAIENLFRVTTPGGYVVCSIPNEHNNYSPEHINEFTVFDAMKLTTKGDLSKLVDVAVKCGGLSTIWTTRRD